MPPQGYCWRLTKERFLEFVADNRIWFGENGNNVPSIKRFLSEVKDSITPMTIWKYAEVGHSQDAKQNLMKLFDNKSFFDYPKSIDLIKRMLQLYTDTNSVILDFFSGSATTAHAVMQLNAEDGGNRKFIMVQLPESCKDDSEASKAGYKNICEIGKERIRRAGDKIKDEKGLEAQNLDIGFKVLKLDSSNIRKWQPDYDNLELSLTDFVNNYVDGRTELDVVYEIMLKYGLDLTYPVDEHDIGGKKVYAIGLGMLIICLDDDLTIDVARGILKLKEELKPESIRVVFKDNGFNSDSNKTNIKEILKAGGVDEFVTV
jgi:adenine-specific DNA-methyltransferase